jgi:hypothetical protein
MFRTKLARAREKIPTLLFFRKAMLKQRQKGAHSRYPSLIPAPFSLFTGELNECERK